MFLDLYFNIIYSCLEIRFTPGIVKFVIQKESVQIGEDWNGKETADVSDIWKTATDSIETPPHKTTFVTRSGAFVPSEPFLVVHAEEDNENDHKRLDAMPDSKPTSKLIVFLHSLQRSGQEINSIVNDQSSFLFIPTSLGTGGKIGSIVENGKIF